MTAFTITDSAGLYRQRAADLIRLAAQASSIGAKATYLSMAQGYESLARTAIGREGKHGH